MNIWYKELIKPSITPPNQVFSIIWSIIYIFMAISFILVFKDLNFKDKWLALTVFLAQLFLNILWTPTFFYFHNIGLALMICGVLWLFVLLTIIEFFKYSKIASILLIPYLIWTTCAIWLNYKILILN